MNHLTTPYVRSLRAIFELSVTRTDLSRQTQTGVDWLSEVIALIYALLAHAGRQGLPGHANAWRRWGTIMTFIDIYGEDSAYQWLYLRSEALKTAMSTEPINNSPYVRLPILQSISLEEVLS